METSDKKIVIAECPKKANCLNEFAKTIGCTPGEAELMIRHYQELAEFVRQNPDITLCIKRSFEK